MNNNAELIAAGHELAKCLDNEPLLDIAKMIVRLADKLEVTTLALREKTKQCEHLANELNAVEAIHNDAVFITDEHYDQCPPEVQKIISKLAVMVLPATDAFLREVRAQGVELLAEHLSGMGISASETSVREFAAGLRQGGAA